MKKKLYWIIGIVLIIATILIGGCINQPVSYKEYPVKYCYTPLNESDKDKVREEFQQLNGQWHVITVGSDGSVTSAMKVYDPQEFFFDSIKRNLSQEEIVSSAKDFIIKNKKFFGISEANELKLKSAQMWEGHRWEVTFNHESVNSVIIPGYIMVETNRGGEAFRFTISMNIRPVQLPTTPLISSSEAVDIARKAVSAPLTKGVDSTTLYLESNTENNCINYRLAWIVGFTCGEPFIQNDRAVIDAVDRSVLQTFYKCYVT